MPSILAVAAATSDVPGQKPPMMKPNAHDQAADDAGPQVGRVDPDQVVVQQPKAGGRRRSAPWPRRWR